MTDTAAIALQVTAVRAATSSASASLLAAYAATETFDRIETRYIDLDTDSPKSVAFGDLPSAALVNILSESGKVRARLTSADGTLAEVPVDPVHFTVSMSVPFTAIDLTRVAGAGTIRVSVTLGAPVT